MPSTNSAHRGFLGPYDSEAEKNLNGRNRNSHPMMNTNGSGSSAEEQGEKLRTKTKVKRNWYGKKVGVTTTTVMSRSPTMDEEMQGPEKRPVLLYAPFYNGVAAGLAFGEWIEIVGLSEGCVSDTSFFFSPIVFIGNGVSEYI